MSPLETVLHNGRYYMLACYDSDRIYNFRVDLMMDAEIKEVFEMLWNILSLYEESDCYNYLPGTTNNEGAWEYFDGLILNTRKKANKLFLGERDSEEYRKLNQSSTRPKSS